MQFFPRAPVLKVYDSVLTEAYIETPEQAEQFIKELKQQLNAAIQNGARVRIR
jgi:flagellar basal body-associated protein FliL